MSLEQNRDKKKKRLKKWQIFVLVIVVLIAIGAIFGDQSTTNNTSTNESEEPKASFSYSAEISRWEPLNPASGRATFTIYNTGDESFVPTTCKVKVQDDSLTYKGYDFISGFTESIKPGAKFMGNVVLTVTKEGAYFVTKGTVDCELKATS
jgi:hypothetical protein